ncbi:MAG TPA: hypothetical protein DEB06_01560 [Phycisphaerales bacterium]|nr:hypothetical protein [Phycisphaerales bacterium]
MSQRQKRTSVALLLTILITGLSAFTWMTVSGPGSRTAQAQSQSFVMNARAIHSALRRVGLTPEALAAVGASAQSAGTVAANAGEFLQENGAALAAADEACAAHAANERPLTRRIRAGLGSEQEVSARSAASQQLAAANAVRERLLDDLFEAATAGCTSGQCAALRNIRAAGATGPMIPLAVHARSEADWGALREAEAVRRHAAQSGETPDAQAVYPLTLAESDQSVSAAMTNMGNNAAAIDAALTAAASSAAE